MTDIDRVVARDQIRQLAYRYADAVDRRDIGQIAGLYSAAARFGPYGTGPDGARGFFDAALSTIGVAFLLVGNHIVEFDGPSSAHGVVSCHAHIDDHHEGLIQQLIRYEDTYVREHRTWLFAKRRHLLWLGWRHADDEPLSQAPANWPENQVGLGSVPYDDPSWRRYWDDHQVERRPGDPAHSRSTSKTGDTSP